MILVDTPIWSLALRRRARDLGVNDRRHVAEWTKLIREGRVGLVGPIRQEILSGVRDQQVWEELRAALRPFPDLRISTPDYERASEFFNRCRSRGIAASSVDLILCSEGHRLSIPIYTTDRDFERYSGALGVRLHEPRPDGGPGGA